jgi:hypothetical protein
VVPQYVEQGGVSGCCDLNGPAVQGEADPIDRCAMFVHRISMPDPAPMV